MRELWTSPYFGIAVSVLAFWAGEKLQKKLKSPFCNPLLFAILAIVLVLLAFDIPYESYNNGGAVINMFLAPATACLAVSIYTRIQILKENAIPILVGLAGSLVSVIPMSCGIFIYYVIMYVKQNSSFLAGSEQVEMTQVFAQVVKSLIGNQTMLVMVAAGCLGVLVVHVVKNLSINYSWGTAIAAGSIIQLIVIFVGDFKFGVSVSVPGLIIAIILSAAVAGVYHFFVFAVDYSRTEYVQFEDADYYYYVKAVPKIAVTKPEVKVQKINTRRTPKH